MSWYDALWEDAPDPLPGFDVARRRAFLLEHVRGGERVLDLGCGEGDFAAAAAQAGAAEVLGVDVAAEAVRRARAQQQPSGHTCQCCTSTVDDPVEVRA